MSLRRNGGELRNQKIKPKTFRRGILRRGVVCCVRPNLREKNAEQMKGFHSARPRLSPDSKGREVDASAGRLAGATVVLVGRTKRDVFERGTSGCLDVLLLLSIMNMIVCLRTPFAKGALFILPRWRRGSLRRSGTRRIMDCEQRTPWGKQIVRTSIAEV